MSCVKSASCKSPAPPPPPREPEGPANCAAIFAAMAAAAAAASEAVFESSIFAAFVGPPSAGASSHLRFEDMFGEVEEGREGDGIGLVVGDRERRRLGT